MYKLSQETLYMQISTELNKFIYNKENKELLNQFKFKELYDKLNKLKHGIYILVSSQL